MFSHASWLTRSVVWSLRYSTPLIVYLTQYWMPSSRDPITLTFSFFAAVAVIAANASASVAANRSFSAVIFIAVFLV